MKNVKVVVQEERRDGDTKMFVLLNISTGIIYRISNCHRTDTPLWNDRNVRCFNGNLETQNRFCSVCFRIYHDGTGILLLPDNI